jgi:Fe-S-cluster containining protein
MNCTECGACCLNQEIPVTPEDNIPPEFVENGKLKNNGCCIFFDLETRHCKQYDKRPKVCIDFKKGCHWCVGIRGWADTLGWFDHMKKPKRELEEYEKAYLEWDAGKVLLNE